MICGGYNIAAKEYTNNCEVCSMNLGKCYTENVAALPFVNKGPMVSAVYDNRMYVFAADSEYHAGMFVLSANKWVPVNRPTAPIRYSYSGELAIVWYLR